MGKNLKDNLLQPFILQKRKFRLREDYVIVVKESRL